MPGNIVPPSASVWIAAIEGLGEGSAVGGLGLVLGAGVAIGVDAAGAPVPTAQAWLTKSTTAKAAD